MHQAGVMCGDQALRSGRERLDDLAPRPRRHEPLAERGPGHELHHDKHLILEGANLVHRDDVRMGEPRHRLRLADQPQPGCGAGAEIAHDLDRDPAIEIRIVRLEHDAHAAGPELAHDAKMTDRRPRCEPRGQLDAITRFVIERLHLVVGHRTAAYPRSRRC